MRELELHAGGVDKPEQQAASEVSASREVVRERGPNGHIRCTHHEGEVPMVACSFTSQVS